MIIKKKVPVYTNRGLDKDNMEKTVVYYEDKVNNAKLIIWSNQGIVGVDNIKEGCVLGRKCADSTAEVQIDSALVSRKHGEIFFSKGEYYYRDLDSLNGTYINGCHISKSEHNTTGAIIGLSGEYAGAKIPVDNFSVILGRDQNLCQLVFHGEKISRKHCSVSYDASRKIYVVLDFSMNGTFLNDGVRLLANKENELQPGSQIYIDEQNAFLLE